MGAGRDQCLLAVRRAHRFQIDVGIARHQPLDDVGDLDLKVVVQHQLSATEPSHRRHRHIVRGRSEATAGDDEIHALGGEEPQLRLDVVGPVSADGDVRQFDTQLEQSVGDPRTVAIGHPSGEDFGSGHHDARARTHVVRHYAHRT